MNNSFVISTTSTLEGYQTESYLVPVIVPSIGAGSFVRNWFARLTDFFGGRSKSYRPTYEKLGAVLSDMSEQATAYGLQIFQIINFTRLEGEIRVRLTGGTSSRIWTDNAVKWMTWKTRVSRT